MQNRNRFKTNVASSHREDMVVTESYKSLLREGTNKWTSMSHSGIRKPDVLDISCHEIDQKFK